MRQGQRSFTQKVFMTIVSAGMFTAVMPVAHAFDCALADKPAYILESRLELAMDVVRANNLQAPEAARLYTLTLMAMDAAENDADIMAAAALALLKKEYPQRGPHLNKFGKYGPCSGQSARDVKRAEKIGQRISRRAARPARKAPGAPQADFGAVLPRWADMRPFALESASQFRPAGPPALDSVEFSEALSAVRISGQRGSLSRTTDQSASARFWAYGDYTSTGPGHWNTITLDVTKAIPTKDRVNILLTLNTAMSDAALAAWDAKYYYRYWRPGAAISQINPDWEPFLDTPRHPEYVSAHSAISAAAASVLTAKLGAQPFCAASETLKRTRRCFDNFYTAAQDAGMSRIYGGIHFPFSNRDGLKLGRDVAAFILQKNPESAEY